MPIRLNLLAEAMAAEEIRRKDPLKRFIWAGVLMVAASLVYSSSLKVRSLVANGEVSRLEARVSSQTNSYALAVANQKKLVETRYKLSSLRQLATNRFLQAPVLNALQRTTVDEVQLTRLRSEQTYTYIEATKSTTNATKRAAAPKAATVTEKILVVLEAKDTGPTPGDQVTKYKEALSKSKFFKDLLGDNEVRLASLSPPQSVSASKPFVPFSLECRLPEKVR